MNHKSIDISSCLIRSWTLYKGEFGLIFFTTLVITVSSSAVSGIPYIGPVISGLINGVLYGGLFVFYLKLIRGQKAELPDAFDGFRFSFVPLMLAGLIISVLTTIAVLAAGIPLLFTVVPLAIKYAENPDLAPDILLRAIGAGAVINIIVCVLVAAFLYSIWIFTLPLIMDKRMQIWPAMETSRKTVLNNFGGIIGLVAVGFLLIVIGVLACCVGLFFTLPIFFGAVAYAYEDLFS